MRRQRGFVLLLGLLLVMVLATAVFLSARRDAALREAERAVTAQRAADTAREVLVAYALALGTNNHPGALPCPDMDGDGALNNTDCQGGDVYLGRVPFATIGVDVGSLHGVEEIWYAVDDSFVDFNPPGGTVNTGTTPSLEIGNRAKRYAGVVIIAGDPVASQRGQRAGSNDPADFLEGANTDGDLLQFAGCDSATCNDRVVGITRRDLLDPVRKRVLGEVRDALDTFFADHGHYPWPAALGDETGACDTGTGGGPPPASGTLPVAAGDCGADYLQDSDFDAGADWVADNDWPQYVYYAVGDDCDPDGGGCTAGGSGLLSVDGVPDPAAAVIATVGPAISTPGKGGPQVRGGTLPHDVEDYLDSIENTNGDAAFDDPVNGEDENDHLRAVAVPAP